MSTLQIKYCIVDGSPVLFAAAISHDEFLKLGKEISSAGFVFISPRDGRLVATTYGESMSLKKSPADRDKKIIEIYVNGGME